jgi:hypothetical protein
MIIICEILALFLIEAAAAAVVVVVVVVVAVIIIVVVLAVEKEPVFPLCSLMTCRYLQFDCTS